MDVLAKRLKWLREKERYAQKDIATKIGMTQSGYQKIEYGERDPKLDVLVTLCDIFDVSADFLLGRNNELKPLRELEFEITMLKSRLEVIKIEMREIVQRLFSVEEQVKEMQRMNEMVDGEVLDQAKIQSRVVMMNDLVHRKSEKEAELKNFSDQFGDALMNYMFLLNEIPESDPKEDRVLKPFLPLRFDIMEELFEEYTIIIYGKNIGQIGYKGTFNTLEEAEQEIDRLKSLYN